MLGVVNEKGREGGREAGRQTRGGQGRETGERGRREREREQIELSVLCGNRI